MQFIYLFFTNVMAHLWTNQLLYDLLWYNAVVCNNNNFVLLYLKKVLGLNYLHIHLDRNLIKTAF